MASAGTADRMDGPKSPARGCARGRRHGRPGAGTAARGDPSLPAFLRFSPPRLLSVPFTSPMLAGVRLRHGPGGAHEFLVPNPAGGSGYYVVEGEALRGLCRLTLHDEVLLERLLERRRITPRVMREVVREVTAMGLAGRQAAEAAGAAEDGTSARHAEATLLLLLLHELGVAVEELVRACRARRMLAVAREKLAERVGRLGLSAADALAAVEQVAPVAAAIGFPDGEGGLYPGIVERLGTLARTLRRWSAPEAGDLASLAGRVAESADFVREIAGGLIRECRRRLLPVAELVVAWHAGSAVRRMFEDLEWWLEGWEHPMARFFAALRHDREYQNAVVRELAHHVLPVRAVQSGERLRVDPPGEGVRSRYVRRYHDWRTGILVSEWLERLETARAEVWR